MLRASGLALSLFTFDSAQSGLDATPAAMEEGREELGEGASLEAELLCSICLCLFQEPVSLSCSHSFCRQCIQKALRVQEHAHAPLTCPMCKIHLGPNLELQKNFHLSSIVEAFRASRGKAGEGSAGGEAAAVPCEYCLDEPQPAVKTCLICDASLCRAHLSKHDGKASHREHIVVAVGAASAPEDRRCPEHGRPRECFCSFEGHYVCAACSLWGDHKGHEVLPMREGHERQLAKLWNVMTWMQRYKSALVTSLEELQKSETQIQTNTKTMTSQLHKLFEEAKAEFTQKEKKILSDIQSNEKKQLAEITKVKKEMEQKREEVEQNLQSLQKLREQEDIFLFFKEFKLATERIASQDSNIVRADVGTVQMDYNRISQCQDLIRYCMVGLESVLQDVQDKLATQIMWNSTKPN